MNERLQNSLLFILPSLIWGSTWYAIKFQLGSVDPLMSVAYRFFIASLLLIVICFIMKLNMNFGIKQHMLFALLGALLFGFNYWLVYLAEEQITSGLIAVIFSLVVFTNAVFGALFIKAKITWKIMVGALLAVTGTILMFKREINMLFGTGIVISSVIMGFGALIFASLGNVLSAYSQKKMIPLMQTNAYSMFYGAMIIFIIGISLGKEISFDNKFSYLISLIYLAIFGSIVAFSSYLKIIGRVGPAKGSYALVFVPVIAMIFSTFFESYEWQESALAGMPILIVGNMIAMDKIKPEKILKKWK